MKWIFTLLLCCSFFLGANAQPATPGYTRMGASLKMLLAQDTPQSPLIFTMQGKRYLPVVVAFASTSAALITSNKLLKIRTLMGNIATADIPLDEVARLSEWPGIQRIELPLLFRKTDTSMRKQTTVDKVLARIAPLDSIYRGRNCLMGIIDDGIDFSHPDFWSSDSALRISYLWNMERVGAPPAGFSYGHEWGGDSLKYFARLYLQKRQSALEMFEKFGSFLHGTPVAGLAAGNNGVATAAEIVAVNMMLFGDSILRSDRVLDAVSYLYGKAQRAKKKCIINMSFGLMDGAPHDGKSLVEQAIDNFCRQKDDLAIFVSAGNNGNTFKHWGGQPIRSDSSFCFFSCAYSGRLYFVIPRQYSNKLSISFTDTKPFNLYAPNSISNDSIIQQTPFFNIGDIINSPRVVYHETKFPNGNLSSNFVLSASHYNDEYDELVVNVQEFTGNNTAYEPHLYRFIWKGEGMVHAWFPFWNLHPLFNFTNPLPNDSTFVMSDNDYTTNIPSHAFTVLSSGAYNLRTCYIHMKSRVVGQYERCRTAHFTSHGPTLDGRIKPDVISPGDNVMSPRARTDSFYGHDFVVDTNTVSFGGTSAASPITAGIAALIWEKYPQYSRQQVFDVIKSSARWDEFAERWGARPNNVAGAGKTDAFAALTGQATDLTAYCAAVDICSPPAPPVVNPPIDPIGPPLATASIFVVWPNPAQQWFNLRYICNENTQLSLFDASGRLLYSRMLPRATSSVQVLLPVERFASGVYYMRITGNNTLFTKALVVAK